MGKPAWEAMVVAEMEQHLPAARLFGTNSMNPDIEGAPWIVRPRENTTRPVDRGSVCDLRQGWHRHARAQLTALRLCPQPWPPHSGSVSLYI